MAGDFNDTSVMLQDKILDNAEMARLETLVQNETGKAYDMFQKHLNTFKDSGFDYQHNAHSV